MKPENILLTEKLHIQITDFGSAINLNDPAQEVDDKSLLNSLHSYRNRKNSFVGTAQYVSPEMLTNKKITPMADLWAYACILFQMLTSKPPFVSGNEYMIFQKIQNLEYTFPDNFTPDAKHLVQSLLKIKATERLGAQDNLKTGGYESIRNHPYFAPLNGDWDMLNKLPPEKIQAVAKMDNTSDLTTELTERGLGEKQITRLLGLHLHDDSDNENSVKVMLTFSQKEFDEHLAKQRETNKFHQFVENNLILKQGLIDKKKGFFPRRRMFLLTTGPHLYYVDPANMVLKGKVPFTRRLRTEAKNFRNFYLHVVIMTHHSTGGRERHSATLHNLSWLIMCFSLFHLFTPFSLVGRIFSRIQLTMRPCG